jgi:hypothetical protein
MRPSEGLWLSRCARLINRARGNSVVPNGMLSNAGETGAKRERGERPF